MTDSTSTENAEAQQVFEVCDAESGMRLDAYLELKATDLSRSRIKGLIDKSEVALEGVVVSSASRKVKAGERYSITIPLPDEWHIKPIAMKLDIVHEDADLLVINKPAGLTVHPAAGNYDYTLVHGLLHHCGNSLSGIGGVIRPGIVHRLDKDTSGLMVVAKHDKAHEMLSKQLKDRSLSRTYEAIVWGEMSDDRGVIEGNIGRHPKDRKKMAVVTVGGKPARTHFNVLEGFYVENKEGKMLALTHVQCKLETGRTHQIRVHMAERGYPLVGDPVYGKKGLNGLPDVLAGFQRQALHARAIGFIHPTSGAPVQFECPLADDMQHLLEIFRGQTV
jgi:23S rRNA pseudouridine1911/1915/1917 synthase